MKKLKIAILSMLALGATALTGFSQGVPPSGSFTVQPVPMPYTILAANTASNLAAGWSTIITNVTTSGPFYTNGSSVLFTNTTYTTNFSYANMSIISQKDLGVVISESAGIGTNTFWFGHGLDSGSVDTNGTVTLAIAHTAAGTAMASTNFQSTWIGGFGTVQVTSNNWVAASAGVTNNYFKFGKIVSVK